MHNIDELYQKSLEDAKEKYEKYQTGKCSKEEFDDSELEYNVLNYFKSNGNPFAFYVVYFDNEDYNIFDEDTQKYKKVFDILNKYNLTKLKHMGLDSLANKANWKPKKFYNSWEKKPKINPFHKYFKPIEYAISIGFYTQEDIGRTRLTLIEALESYKVN